MNMTMTNKRSDHSQVSPGHTDNTPGKGPLSRYEIVDDMKERMREEILESTKQALIKGIELDASYSPKESLEDGLAHYQNIPDVTDLYKSMFGKMGRENMQAMEQAAMASVGDTGSSNPSLSIDEAIHYHGKDAVILKLINSEGMIATNSMIQGIKDFIQRVGRPMHGYVMVDDRDIKLSRNPEERMDQMIDRLKKVDGLKDAMMMHNNFPELATIIVKLNMASFSEEETEEKMNDIEKIIELYRPDELVELEVIYHTKVVY